MNELQPIEIKGMRVLTTKQLAEAYGVNEDRIQYNFRYNKEKYVEGRHYIEVVGEELKNLKRMSEFHLLYKMAKHLYLWTEKGALLHAKSINTDKAWEVYDRLVDFYFRARDILSGQEKEQWQQDPQKPTRIPVYQQKGTHGVVDAPENRRVQELIRKVQNDMICMDVLLDACNKYQTLEEYKAKMDAVCGVAGILRADVLVLSAEQVKVVEKII